MNVNSESRTSTTENWFLSESDILSPFDARPVTLRGFFGGPPKRSVRSSYQM